MVFIYISLMINDVDHYYTCMFATHVFFFLVKCLLKPFAYFFTGLSDFTLESSVYVLGRSPLIDASRYLHPIFGLSFYSLHSVF